MCSSLGFRHVEVRKSRNSHQLKLFFLGRCYGLIEEVGGADVIVFMAFVYEYDNSCPPPNKGCVYIAYLDSISYATFRRSAK